MGYYRSSPPPASTTQAGLVELAEDGEVAGGKAVQANDSRLSDGGDVTSVNGQTGIVVLDAEDVGADATGTAAAGDAAHLLAYAHGNIPTTSQKAALAGTSGTPGATNPYVTTEDSRMSDSRAPTAHAASHNAGGSDALAIDAAAATGSLRTLGPGATQAAPGDDARFPTADENAALAGTNGAPSGSNKYVTNSDPRLEVATVLQETSGPTNLTIGPIYDGQVVQRVGTTLVGFTLVYALAVINISGGYDYPYNFGTSIFLDLNPIVDIGGSDA